MTKHLMFNWKMNPKKLAEALKLAEASDIRELVVFPPFVFLEEVKKVLKHAVLGAQDLFWQTEKEGSAATGEISGEELKNLGVRYVIVGHSERRHTLGETDAIVAKKYKTAMEVGLIPILCIGETKLEKEKGQKDEVLLRQIEVGLSCLNDTRFKKHEFLIAYEPVWAIGTGNPETPEHAARTISFIKEAIASRFKAKPAVLYGGSVDSKNIKNYVQYKQVDGALIGGASLKKEEVKKIVAVIK